jgi:excisionase family DNA binding protein
MNNVMPRATVLRPYVNVKSKFEEEAVLAGPIHMLTIPEACKSLHVSKHLVYKLINEGRLKSVRIGRRRLISSASIARLIAQLEAEVPEAG